MKTTPSQKVRIGLFTFAGLLVVIAAVFFIGNQKSLFSATFKLNGMFNNVNGLQVGNNVRFAGINVGVVDDINIINDTTVKVTLTINEDVKKFVKKDARMSIGSDGLMGDKLVVLMPGGSNTTQMVKDGDLIGSVNPVDVDKIIGKFTKMADNAGTLIDNLGQIVAKINHGQGSLGRLLNNDKMAKEMENTVSQAKATIKTVHKTSATLNEDLKAAQHNFLLKGFFKKKQKVEKARQDSIKKAQEKAAKKN
ncbi:MlaD family protein [Mucilaginibacter panaciglaebae]|uniref:Mce/MlaD domain-containing protein n=1 Tax=Mucilaginibacter panaciglaebae TaxID=502331 RepID=A0ABP7X387_9SPHI